MSWLWSSKAKKKPISEYERSTESNLFVQSDIHDIVNPLSWEKLPEIVQKSCPKWKDDQFSRSYSEGTDDVKPLKETEVVPPVSPQGSARAPPINSIEYTVQEGDTLNSIASKFDMTRGELTSMNKLAFQTVVLPGRVLYVNDPNITLPRPNSENKMGPKSTQPVVHPSSAESTQVSHFQLTQLDSNGPGVEVCEPGETPQDSVIPYMSIEDEISPSHIRIKGKYLTKEMGCVKGFFLLTSKALTFTPHQQDPLVMENTSAPYETVIFMEDIIYSAIVSNFDLIEHPIQSPYWLEVEEKLSSLQPPHPLPGRPVREPLSVDHELIPSKIFSCQSEEFERVDKDESVERLIECSESEIVSEPCTHKCTEGNSDDDKDQVGVTIVQEDQVAIGGTPIGVGGDDLSDPLAVSRENSLSFGQPYSIDTTDQRLEWQPSNDNGLSCIQEQERALGLGMPKYLKVKVATEPHHTFSESANAVNIPGKRFKDEYWFAIANKNVDNVITFFLHNHPKVKLRHRHEWVDGSFVMIDVDGENALSVNSNHYSEPWDIISLKDICRTEIPQMVTTDLPLPSLSETSELLIPEILQQLSNNLIAMAIGLSWTLGYSTFRDGFSLQTLYRKLQEFEECPCILVLKDQLDYIFGATLPCSLRRSDRFYGTGESYLFRHSHELGFEMYRWTGRNEFFVKGDKDCLMIGGGDGRCGLWIDENLLHGSSSPCDTFGNETLSSSPEFVIVGLEAWMLL